MALIDGKPKFEFRSDRMSEGTFAVVRMSGEEALSKPFRFELLMVAEESEIDFEQVVGQGATLRILPGNENEQGAGTYHGVVSEFEELYQVDQYTLYRAVLRPRLWLLSRYFLSEVYLNKSVPELLEHVFRESGLNANDYQLRLHNGPYPTYEYICQWQESYFDFASRLMEREGVYYFFESDTQGTKLIVADSMTAQPSDSKQLAYRLESEMESGWVDDALQRFVCRREIGPRQVMVRNYDYQKASHEVEGRAPAESDGAGQTFLYGEYADSNERASRLAKLRAEEAICRTQRYDGTSTAAGVGPGRFVEVAGCYRESFNGRYLPVEVRHFGSQTGLLLAGLGGSSAPPLASALAERGGFALLSSDAQRTADGSEGDKGLVYRNDFVAIKAQVQYRPPRRTPWPRIDGVVNAFIDAEGSGKYAELDDKGRYKVQLPFDLTDKRAQKASAWIRMTTPYSSPGAGMHFPLLKGTEVLLSFVEGDPDRPIITGAVYNSLVDNVVTNQNPTQHVIHTAGGNVMEMDDMEGQQRVTLSTPTRNTFVSLGAALAAGASEGARSQASGNGGSSTHSSSSANGYTISTDGSFQTTVGSGAKIAGGVNAGDHYEKITGEYNLSADNHYEKITGEYNLSADKMKVKLSGSNEIEVEGTKRELIRDTSVKLYYGYSTETHFGGTNSNYIGASLDIRAGGKIFIDLLGVLNVLFGVRTEIHNSKINATDKKIQAIQRDIRVATSRISAVEDDMVTANGRIDTANDLIITANNRIDTADNRINTAENNIQTTNNRIDTAENDIHDVAVRIQNSGQYIVT